VSCSVHFVLGTVVVATLLVAGVLLFDVGAAFFPIPAAGCLTLAPLPLPAVEPPLGAAVPLPDDVGFEVGGLVGGLVAAGLVGVVLLGAGLVGVVLFGGILRKRRIEDNKCMLDPPTCAPFNGPYKTKTCQMLTSTVYTK